MRMLSKWVLPALRLVLVAAVAVALTKLAFFSGATDEATDTTTPSGTVHEPVVKAATKTVTNDVSISASVVADSAVPAKAGHEGTIGKLLVSNGDTVAVGAPIATVVTSTPRDPLIGPDGAETPQKPLVSVSTVTAAVAGVVSGLTVIPEQAVAVGDTVAQVAPATFHLTGSLSTSQQYRLVSRPAEALVTIKGGPAPFTCTALTVASSTSAGQTAGDDAAPSAGPTISCAVPAGVTVFDGLAAKLTVAAGVAKDAVTVPVTAVEGAAGKGTVYLADEDGGSTGTRDVTLGLTDGTVVQVTGGLKVGETVLEFVPGAAADQDGCESGGGVDVDSGAGLSSGSSDEGTCN